LRATVAGCFQEGNFDGEFTDLAASFTRRRWDFA